MLHLVLEAQPHDPENRVRIITFRELLDESRHLFIDVLAIRYGFLHRWPRARAALWSLNARAESLVIRIEVEKKFVRVGLVTRLELLQHSFKEPGGVADVPSRRAHELGGLHYIVF